MQLYLRLLITKAVRMLFEQMKWAPCIAWSLSLLLFIFFKSRTYCCRKYLKPLPPDPLGWDPDSDTLGMDIVWNHMHMDIVWTTQWLAEFTHWLNDMSMVRESGDHNIMIHLKHHRKHWKLYHRQHFGIPK